MYRAMVAVGVCCGLLIVGAFQVTRPVIERNRAEALQSAIFQVLPKATTTRAFRLDESSRFSPASGEGDGEALIYAGYDDDEKLVGLAVEARGMGYQDVISLIYGYSLAKQAIIGIEVLESKETPGLGDKIETDPEFLKSFERLDVSLVEDQSALAHPIVAVKRGKKTNPWEVDGITGATISSHAIATILNSSAQRWAPLIQRNLRDFQGGD
jgi:electron transport complex protein RnfG